MFLVPKHKIYLKLKPLPLPCLIWEVFLEKKQFLNFHVPFFVLNTENGDYVECLSRDMTARHGEAKKPFVCKAIFVCSPKTLEHVNLSLLNL